MLISIIIHIGRGEDRGEMLCVFMFIDHQILDQTIRIAPCPRPQIANKHCTFMHIISFRKKCFSSSKKILIKSRYEENLLVYRRGGKEQKYVWWKMLARLLLRPSHKKHNKFLNAVKKYSHFFSSSNSKIYRKEFFLIRLCSKLWILESKSRKNGEQHCFSFNHQFCL